MFKGGMDTYCPYRWGKKCIILLLSKAFEKIMKRKERGVFVYEYTPWKEIMRDYLKEIIHLALREQGLSKNKLIDQLGEHNLCRKTLQRLDSGDSISLESYRTLFKFFGMELPYEPKDAYEEEMIKECIYGADESIDGGSTSIRDRITYLNREIGLYRRFCGKNFEPPYESHIYDMIRLFHYLPIIPPNELNDAFARMGGDYRGRLTYFLNQLEHLYENIPEKLKKDADEALKENYDPYCHASNEARKKYSDYLAEKAKVENNLHYYLQKHFGLMNSLQPDAADATTETEEEEQTDELDSVD